MAVALPLPLRILFSRLAEVVVPSVTFVVSALVVYLPIRYLLLPASRHILDALGVDPAIELPILKVFHAVAVVFALFTAALVSGLAGFLTATAAITAGLTIALGFAARDVLSNVVSGVFIVLDPTFDIGDWIRWDEQEGIIEDISFRTTRVHTFDNELIAVPNSQLTTNAVVNPVAKDNLRLSIPVEISADNDVAGACDVLRTAARDHSDIRERPAPTIYAEEIVETSIVLVARFWIARPDRADFIRIRSEYVRAVKTGFDEAGIDLPTLDLAGTLGVRDSISDTDS